MGLFLPGGNREVEAENLGNPEEEFAVFWEEKKRKVMKMNRVKLSIEDIEPLEKAIEKYTALGSGLVWYMGEGWDWRMARYALEELKEMRDELYSEKQNPLKK